MNISMRRGNFWLVLVAISAWGVGTNVTAAAANAFRGNWGWFAVYLALSTFCSSVLGLIWATRRSR